MRKSRALVRFRLARTCATASLLVASLFACGSRTGLFLDELETSPLDDSGVTTRDGTVQPRDANVPDRLPPIDASNDRDVDRRDCPDADATLIYLVGQGNELYSFYPPDASFRIIGTIACPAPEGTTPFSMAVDRRGTAYVLFDDGKLYRVSTATAACTATSYQVGQQGFDRFGMGYATNDVGPTETLYVAATREQGSPTTGGLGRINTSTFVLSSIGNFVPSIERAELTGTGDGRLFAFYTKDAVAGSFIGEIDTATAAVTAETRLATVDQGNGWAFAFWGGDFYTFTAPGGSTVVMRYRPSDNSLTEVATTGSLIVGAGVSTCAPQ